MTPLSSFQKILVALIFLTIVFFGFFHVTESPPFSFDEGWVVQVATNISRLGADGLQFSPGNIEHVSVLTSIGYPLIYTLAFWFKLFGAGVFQARIMMVIFMLGLAVSGFLLIRRLYGNTMALSSLAILAVFPPFYSFGKNVIGEVPVLFFLMLFLLFFNLATSNSNRKPFWLVLAGLSAGLCVVTKTMALAFVPVLVAGAFMAFRRGLVTWRDIGTVAISAIVPVAVWVVVHFQSGDSLASVFDYYSNPAALTDRTAVFWINLRRLFTSIGSLFLMFLMTVWIAGIAIRLKTKTKIPTEEFMVFIFSTIIIFASLQLYGDARYLFPVQTLAIMFSAYSLYHIFFFIPTKFDVVKKTRIYSFGIVILCVSGLYQLSFNSYIADSYGSTYTEDMSKYFSLIPDSTSIFFYDTPHVVPFFSGRNYYQRIAMFEKWVLGSEFAPIVAAGGVDMLVLSPPMTKADEKVPLDGYLEVVRFSKISVLKKKTE